MKISALRLAATYDPAELLRHRVQGVTPDRAEARKWYERARELGAPEAQEHLSDALTHMADGLVMFDGDGRLVLCSARFREMFSIPHEAMLAGSPLRGIFYYNLQQKFSCRYLPW